MPEDLYRTILPAAVMFRCLNAVFVTTYFNPDEYWQSLEVAHSLVFQSGYRTWEWGPSAQIRSPLHPIMFAGLYKLLSAFQLDTPWAIIYMPRVLQGALMGLTDYFTAVLATRWFGAAAGRLAAPINCTREMVCQFSTLYHIDGRYSAAACLGSCFTVV
jgi:phosphatidylinositol glycan class B